MSFAVVKFVNEEESYSEIPCSWISEDKSFCYWPNQKNCSQLMTRNTVPAKHWKREPIVIEGYYDTLEKARKIAEDPDYTSQDEDSRKRQKPKKLINSDSSEEDTYDDYEQPPQFKKLQKKEPSKQQYLTQDLTASKDIIGCYEFHEGVLTKVPESVTDDEAVDIATAGEQIDVDHEVPCEVNNANDEEHQIPTGHRGGYTTHDNLALSTRLDEIYKLQVENRQYLKAILKKVNKLEIQETKTKPQILFEHISHSFPFAEVNALVEFEKHLDIATKESLIAYIERIGGKNMKDNIHRCMKAIYSNEMAKSCSWLGQRGNFKIKNTEIMDIIKNIITQQYQSLTDAEFEGIVSEWFRLASSRIKIKKPQ